MEKRLKAVLDSLQGRWVDVNGESVLDIQGDRMNYSHHSWSKNYNLIVREEYGRYVLDNRDDASSFGVMSALELNGDVLHGYELHAYEQILDGDSHAFRFVREEKKAELLKTEDLSKDLPKIIESRSIRELTLVFNYDSPGKYGLEDLQTGSYCWEISKKDDETWSSEFRGSGSSYIIMDVRREADAEYMRGLAELLCGEDIAGRNGYYMKNAVNKAGYSLFVTFDSGERLSIQASGDPGDTCVFSLPALVEYAKKLGID